MALPKKLWEISRFDRGLSNVNEDGAFWWSQGLDFEISSPYARVAKKFTEEDSSVNLAGQLADVRWSTYFNDIIFVLSKTNAKFVGKPAVGAWAFYHTNTQSGGLGLMADDDYMYYASEARAGRVDKATMTWSDAWQLFNETNNGNLVPIVKFLKFICFGNLNHLAVWDVGASSWNDNRVALPNGYVIKWLKPLSDWLVISAHHPVSGSILFLWDGVSQTYNRAIQLPRVTSLAGVVDNNVLYVITDDGWINVFNGSGLSKIPDCRFPDMEDTDKISLNPDAVKLQNGVIYIGKKSDGTGFAKRYYAGGIWIFNPATKALYFKHMLSNLGITNIANRGVISVGSIFTYSNETRVAWDDSSKYIIDTLGDANPSPYNYGMIYVSPIFDNTPALRKRFIQNIINFYKPLPNSSAAKYILKYNITEKYEKSHIYVLSGDYSYFTVSTIPSCEIGDEVTVLSGNGASQIRHITAIDTSTKTITVDSGLSGGASFDNTSYVSISSFKKAGTISGDSYPGIVNKLLRFNARAKKIQLKVEMHASNFDVGLANMTTVFIPDKIIK